MREKNLRVISSLFASYREKNGDFFFTVMQKISRLDFAASEFSQVIRDNWDVSLRTLRNTTCVLN